jgi:uncharacterized protein (TIGR02453 family)
MKEVLRFLHDLSANNNKPWFDASKERYLEAKSCFEQFAGELISAISAFDNSIGPLSPKDCTFRIYKDLRFTKDKSPYKTQMGVFVVPGGKKSGFNGYYFLMGVPESGNMVALGNYYCLPPVLKILREDILLGKGDFRHILSEVDPRFYLDTSNALKRVPAGFPADSPDSNYFKLKNFSLMWVPDNKFVTAPDLVERLAVMFKTAKPFLDYTNRAIEYAREEKTEHFSSLDF